MRATNFLDMPNFVDHKPYYMLVHHSRSGCIQHIIDFITFVLGIYGNVNHLALL